MLMNLEVHVSAGGPAGIAHQRYSLSPPYALSLPYDIAFVMSVDGGEATAVVDHHHVPIAVGAASTKQDHALIHRDNWCAAFARDVDATVKTPASHAKT